MSHKPNYYKILGVPRDAPQEVVRAAYRRLAQKYHPDRHQGRDDAEDKMAFINSAYGVLSDPDARAQYDTAVEAPPPRRERPAPQPHHEHEPESTRPWLILWAVVSVVVLALGWVAIRTLFPATPKARIVQQVPAPPAPAQPGAPAR